MSEPAAASPSMMRAPVELNPDRKTRLILASAAFLSAFILYYLTCASGVVWQDSAMFQYRLWKGDLKGELGLALAHPLYILLGQFVLLFNPSHPAFSLNLTSVFCATVAVTICIDLLYLLTRCATSAIAGAISLAVSHTFWTHAVIAEVYDLYALCLLAELWLLYHFLERRSAWWFVLALLVNGISLSNHLLAILHLPIYVALVIWDLRRASLKLKHIFAGIFAWLSGGTLYFWLIAQSIYNGQTVFDALREALLGPPGRDTVVLTTSFSWTGQLAKSLLYFGLNFPTPLALLAPIGAYFAYRNARLRTFALIALAIFIINFIFAFRYMVPDQFVFFTPGYVIFALFIGLAMQRIGKPHSYAKLALCLATLIPAAVYEVAPNLCRKSNVSLGTGRIIPYRDSYTYFLRPRKNGEDSAEKFARTALGQAAPAGLLIADITIKNVLVYVRDVEGVERNVVLHEGLDTTPRPPVIALTPENIAPFVDRNQAWACSNQRGYVPDWVLDRYDLTASGILFSLKPKAPPTPMGRDTTN